MNTIIKVLLASVSVLSVNCGENQDLQEDALATKQVFRLTMERASIGKAAALTQLVNVVPNWDTEQILRVPSSASAGANLRLPREIAREFTSEALAFVERRANGRDVFKDETAQTVVKVDERNGFWKMIRPPERLSSGTPFSPEGALAEGERIFQFLGLPSDQRGLVINTDFMGQASDGSQSVLARHVRIHRSINGHRVRGSQFAVSFDLNGRPFRVESSWPAFRLEAASRLHSRTEALAALSDALADRFAGARGIGEVVSDISYHYDPARGAFEPVVSVSVFPAGTIGMPERVEYSLFDGLKEAQAEAAVDG